RGGRLQRGQHRLRQVLPGVDRAAGAAGTDPALPPSQPPGQHAGHRQRAEQSPQANHWFEPLLPEFTTTLCAVPWTISAPFSTCTPVACTVNGSGSSLGLSVTANMPSTSWLITLD